MSVDRQLYVCDRVGDRLQVFTPEGKFVKEAFYDKNTKNAGSVWDIAFSKDAQQKYIFMADGVNEKVRDHRSPDAAGADGLRRRRPPAGLSSTASTASRPTRRATSTRRKPTKANACSGSSTRASARSRTTRVFCGRNRGGSPPRPPLIGGRHPRRRSGAPWRRASRRTIFRTM